MKLYAWQPQGHGEYSWFVMAENEQEAILFVEKEMQRRKGLRISDINRIGEYECKGWGTDYYQLTVMECGGVISNDNS